MLKKVIIKVLSLFDGLGGARIALDRLGYECEYYASEIDKYAIQIAKKNYPDIKEIGSVTDLYVKDGYLWSKDKKICTSDFDLLIGGSPCQGFSVAGHGLNFDDPRSKLFFEYVRILNELKPKHFVLENVMMKDEWVQIISDHLFVNPIKINSAKVTAQNRVRLYWTNIPGLRQPKDKKIMLKDVVLKDAILDEEALDVVCVAERGRPNEDGVNKQQLEPRKDGKTNALTSVQKDNKVLMVSNIYGGFNEPPRVNNSGKSNTIITASGGGHIPSVVTFTETRTEEAKEIRKKTKKEEGKDFCPRRGKELKIREDNKSNCITANLSDKEHILVTKGSLDYMNRGEHTDRHWEHAHDVEDDKSKCITANMRKGTPYNILIVDKKMLVDTGRIKSSKHKKNYFQYDISGKGHDSQDQRAFYLSGKHGTLPSEGGESKAKVYINPKYIRKLLPVECERLQGLDDNYTEGVSNTQRYKMLGNGFTIPVIEHILKNMGNDGYIRERGIQGSFL